MKFSLIKKIKSFRLVFELIDVLRQRRSELRLARKITRKQYRQLRREESELDDIAINYGLLMLRQIETDLEEPGAAIKSATEQVENTIKKIEGFNEILGIVTGVVDLFEEIAETVVSPTPFANVKGLVTNLQDLLARI